MFEQSSFGNIAGYYDLFELKSKKMYEYVLDVLGGYFTRFEVSTILDLACGTGAQAIPLAKKGYRVTGCDISTEMIQIAQQKAKTVDVIFKQGDMRFSRFGEFDAAIAILNSIGYLSRSDFLLALDNINANLKDDGLFVFDNTNLDAIKAGALSQGKTIDSVGEYRGKKFVRFFQSTVDLETGLMTINWEAFIQQGFQPLEVFSGTWNRQIYALDELEKLLSDKGFKVLEFFDRNGGAFSKTDSFSVMVVAQKCKDTL